MSEKQSTGLEFQALQTGWEERIDQLNLRTGERLEKYFGLHRESIVRALPQLTIRGKYRPEWSPAYTFLIAEDQRKINDLLENAEGGKSLVIAASGLSFLASLTNNVREIDVVDSDPNQIAWNYALAAFIGLAEKQDLEEALLAFRKTNYNFFDFSSMQLPEVRRKYLSGLPQMLVRLGVSEEMKGNVTQYFNYNSFEFDLQMKKNETDEKKENKSTLWDRFYSQYDQIRDRVLSHEGWQFHNADLLDWLAKHINCYDAAYTSNVYEFVDGKVSFDGFTNLVVSSLRSGGVGNVYRTTGLPIPPGKTRGSNYSVLSYESCRVRNHPNWLVVKKD